MMAKYTYSLPDGSTLEAEDLDGLRSALAAAERVTESLAEACAATLQRIREIRVKHGLGLLVWGPDMYGSQVARMADGILIYYVRTPSTNSDQKWLAQASHGLEDPAWCASEAEAKAVCEQWYSEWLERAGLQPNAQR